MLISSAFVQLSFVWTFFLVMLRFSFSLSKSWLQVLLNHKYIVNNYITVIYKLYVNMYLL